MFKTAYYTVITRSKFLLHRYYTVPLVKIPDDDIRERDDLLFNLKYARSLPLLNASFQNIRAVERDSDCVCSGGGGGDRWHIQVIAAYY